jgi:hypothetical protein
VIALFYYSFVPMGLDYSVGYFFPTMNCWAIINNPLRDKDLDSHYRNVLSVISIKPMSAVGTYDNSPLFQRWVKRIQYVINVP